MELWEDPGREGRRRAGSVVLVCGHPVEGFGEKNDSEDELDVVEAGDEGGVPVTGVLGTVLTYGEKSNLTILLLGWRGDAGLRGCAWGLGSGGGGGK